MDEFLKELTELTKKHGFVIGGCGCCGSPWVWKTESAPNHDPDGKYGVEKDGDRLKWIERAAEQIGVR